MKDTDGIYYWTIKLGDADSAWLTDVDNNKIPTTGKDGENGELHEPLSYTDIGKFAYCSECQKKLFKYRN